MEQDQKTKEQKMNDKDREELDRMIERLHSMEKQAIALQKQINTEPPWYPYPGEGQEHVDRDDRRCGKECLVWKCNEPKWNFRFIKSCIRRYMKGGWHIVGFYDTFGERWDKATWTTDQGKLHV